MQKIYDGYGGYKASGSNSWAIIQPAGRGDGAKYVCRMKDGVRKLLEFNDGDVEMSDEEFQAECELRWVQHLISSGESVNIPQYGGGFAMQLIRKVIY